MVLQKITIKQTIWAGFSVMLYILIIDLLKLPEVFLWIAQITILLIFFKGIKNFCPTYNIDKIGRILVLLFIGWLILGFIRSIDDCQSYWEWKNSIGNFLKTLFFIVIFLATNPYWPQGIYKLFWKCYLPLIILCLIGFSNYTVPYYLSYSTLLLFFPIIPKQKRWILLSIVCIFAIYQEQRNDLAKIAIAMTIGGGLYIFGKKIPSFLFKTIHTILMILPIILLYLGASGYFNVFKMDEYIKKDYTRQTTDYKGESYQDDLKADTRTFIYVNVTYTLTKYDAWICGRNTAFGDEGPIEVQREGSEKFGLKGRYGNEVQIMNLLLWYGIISSILYFLIYLRASYLAIYKSNSITMKGIGIYTAFLWVWSFIWEVTNIEIYFMMNIIFLGMCFSKTFLKMNDSDFKYWIYPIFNKSTTV